MQFLKGQRVVKVTMAGLDSTGFASIGETGTVVGILGSMIRVEWDNFSACSFDNGDELCFDSELSLESIENRARELAAGDIIGDGPRQYDDYFDHPVLSSPRHETFYPDSELLHGPDLCGDPGCRLCYPDTETVELSESEYRKMLPMGTVATEYFPLARQGEAAVAWVGNEKHNPGEHLHWARGKSDDHVNCIHRHLQDMAVGDGWDTTTLPDGRVYQVRHAAAVAWRASAVAQLDAESVGGQVVRRLK